MDHGDSSAVKAVSKEKLRDLLSGGRLNDEIHQGDTGPTLSRAARQAKQSFVLFSREAGDITQFHPTRLSSCSSLRGWKRRWESAHGILVGNPPAIILTASTVPKYRSCNPTSERTKVSDAALGLGLMQWMKWQRDFCADRRTAKASARPSTWTFLAHWLPPAVD